VITHKISEMKYLVREKLVVMSVFMSKHRQFVKWQ